MQEIIISIKDNGIGRWLAGLLLLTYEASLHSSIVVVGKSIEDTAAFHFIRLVKIALDDPHDLVVAQFIACISCNKTRQQRFKEWSSQTLSEVKKRKEEVLASKDGWNATRRGGSHTLRSAGG